MSRGVPDLIALWEKAMNELRMGKPCVSMSIRDEDR